MNIFSRLRKGTNTFFDRLQGGSVDKILEEAKQKAKERDAIEKEKREKREAEELEAILEEYPLKPRKE